MNSPRSHDPKIDEQAAYWAARLDGDVLDAGDRAALDAWLAKSPEHRAALSDYCQLSADLEEQLPELVSSGAVKMPATAPKARRFFTLPIVTTLTLAAAAALAVIIYVARPAPQIENVATAVAQRSSTTLADGTHVELNAHTSLRFENTKTERRVRLSGGEALFTVAKDRTRPFIVETPHGSVRVTGTIFNVRNEATTATPFEVTVVEGSVDVRPSAARDQAGPYSLVARDQLSASADGTIHRRELAPATVSDVLLWREGKIFFEEVPLSEVAARLARYHGIRITVDPAVANREVGGLYRIDDLTAFLTALEAVLPVKTNRDLSGVVSIGLRPGS